jgi:CubicO group peptidase (beta-lactamase class C family)
MPTHTPWLLRAGRLAAAGMLAVCVAPLISALATASSASASTSASARVPANDAASQTQSDETSAARKQADAVLARWEGHRPGCSVAVSHQGKVIYRRGSGLANLEYDTPITPASVFHVASVSKQFTAMSVLLLAERGRLSLDDEVSRHVPGWAATPPVTIRQLLNHTAGLRDVFLLTEMAAPGDRGLGTADWLVSLLARQRRLNSPPGAEYSYNNGGYLLLADIVKRVSGQSLRDFAKANIFEPLGMTQTFFHDDASIIVKNRATGYVRRGDGFAIAIGFDSLVGNGGLFTTPSDLLRWEDNFVTPRVGTPALVRSMETATPLTGGGTSPYGFGLQIADYRGRRTFGHGGGDPGTSAYTLRFPDDGLAVAIACNLDEIDSLTPALDLADAFLGPRPGPAAASANATATATAASPSPSVALSESQLSKVAGLYRDPSKQFLLRFYVRDGVLMGSSGASAEGGWAVVPSGATATTFRIPNTSITIEFEPDASGKAKSLRVLGERPQPTILERLPDAFQPASADLTAAAGRYASTELDVVYTIAHRADALTLEIPNRKPIALQPIARDTFVASYLGVVRFSRDPDGAITGLTAHSPGVHAIGFERERVR